MARQRDEQFLIGGPDDDILIGDRESNLLWGRAGNDVLYGMGGQDTLYGHEGNDRLYGGDDGDGIYGGLGDDVMYGGAGNDTLIDDEGGNEQAFGEDGDDTITIYRYGATSLSASQVISGGDGNDILTLDLRGIGLDDNYSEADIDGGAGDDIVSVVGMVKATIDLGSGNDSVAISGTHTLRLGEGNDLVTIGSRSVSGIITIEDFKAGDNGDRINLQNAFGNTADPTINPFSNGGAAVEQRGADVLLRVGSAVVILKNTLLTDLTPSNFSGLFPGGAAQQGGVFHGSLHGERILASFGSDQIFGGLGDDELYARDGNDALWGGDGDDVLDGGLGDDVIHGGRGNDSMTDAWTFGMPGGNDVYFGEEGNDVVLIQRNNAADSRITVWGGAGDDTVGNFQDRFWGGPLGSLIFDGGDGNDGFGPNNTDHWRFDGGYGDDRLGIAGVMRGSDLFIGEGVFEGGAGHDTVAFGASAANLTITIVDENTFRIGTTILVHDVEGFFFVADGAFSRDFSNMPRGLTLGAIGGPITLVGTAFDDTLAGADYQDSLDGGAGYDTAVFKGNFRDYVVTTVDGVTTVQHRAVPTYNGPDTLRNIERLEFDDGWYTLDGHYIPAVIEGTDGVDHMAGRAWSDTIRAGAGDDVIRTSTGKDVIDGGAGNDVVEAAFARKFYSILQIGSDFLIKGWHGSTLLVGVEAVRFADGSVLELNRMSSTSPGVVNADQPLVLPALETTSKDVALVQVLERMTGSDGAHLPDAVVIPPLPHHDSLL